MTRLLYNTFLIVLFGCCPNAMTAVKNVDCLNEQSVSVEQPKTEENSKPGVIKNDDNEDLSLKIAIPHYGDHRSITLDNPDWHFHVLVTNNTRKPVELWKEWCSWGYFSLSFETIDAKGNKKITKKRQRGWTKNLPDTIAIPPGESFPIDVYWKNDIWENIPHHSDGIKTGAVIKVRAVFEMEKDEMFKEHEVWEGKVYSEWEEYALWE